MHSDSECNLTQSSGVQEEGQVAIASISFPVSSPASAKHVSGHMGCREPVSIRLTEGSSPHFISFLKKAQGILGDNSVGEMFGYANIKSWIQSPEPT